MKLENVQVSPVLSGKPVIEDLAVLAQLMSPGIDEGFVLEVLMKAAPNGVEAEQRALEVESATADHGRTREVLLETSDVLVVEGIGPKSGVVGETVGEQLEGLLEKVLPVSSLLFVPHPECDLVEGDPVHVVVAKILDYFSLRPVLETHAQEVSSRLLSFSTTLKTKGLPPARRPCSLATWTG